MPTIDFSNLSKTSLNFLGGISKSIGPDRGGELIDVILEHAGRVQGDDVTRAHKTFKRWAEKLNEKDPNAQTITRHMLRDEVCFAVQNNGKSPRAAVADLAKRVGAAQSTANVSSGDLAALWGQSSEAASVAPIVRKAKSKTA